MPNAVTPVKTINVESDSKRLDLVSSSEEEDNLNMASHLVERDGRYFLCVQHPLIHADITGRFGKVTPARFYNFSKASPETKDGKVKDIEVDVIRNHPIQYAGLVFRTVNGSEYGVSENYKLMRLKNPERPSNGLTIQNIAGIDDKVWLHSKVASYLESREEAGLNDFLCTYGRAVKPGKFIAMTFVKEEAEKAGRIGCKTSLIEGVRQATAEELARYS